MSPTSEFHLYVLHGAQSSGEQKLLCVRASVLVVLVCSDVFDRGINFFFLEVVKVHKVW